MSLLSRRSFAEARIALGSFDRFLLLYDTMFAAFGVASPFLPALLHERGLGPSEIRRSAGGGNRRPTDHLPGRFRASLIDLARTSRSLPSCSPWPLASRLAMIFRPGLRSSSLSVSLTLRRWRHRADCRRDDPRRSARPVSIWVGARWGVGSVCRGLRERRSGCRRRRVLAASYG